MSQNIDHYYTLEEQKYKEILYRDGYFAQGREWNEMQFIFNHRMTKLANSLFKDGDVLKNAQIVVNVNNGRVQAQAGTIYLSGDMWLIESREFMIPTTGTLAVGIRLVTKTISEKDDPRLRNPATGSSGEGTPGAWRRQVIASWAYENDGGDGKFYPVYVIDDAVQRPKETPPTLDSFNLALARYDRDSTGTGTYIVNGLSLVMGEDLEDGRQVYHLSEGRGHVAGMSVELTTSRRIVYDPEPNLRFIDTEVHIATAESGSETGQRINISNAPLKDVTGLRITKEKTATIIHGAYTGVLDALPDNSIVSIEKVQQGDTIYQFGEDYIKTGDMVDWSLSGNEPSPGSTYEVVYRCIESISPLDLDVDGFTVMDAVSGTQIMVSYNQMLPRYDRLAMTHEGLFVWYKGVASAINPREPIVPNTMLLLATVYQSWRTASRKIIRDAIMVVPFDEIARINERVEYAMHAIAKIQLETDVSTRESGVRVGLFVDPLLNNDMRDQGLVQSAAIVDGVLTLPIINAQALQLSTDVLDVTSRDYSVIPILEQPFRTGEMQVNPYMAFDPLPAKVNLVPAVDHWVQEQTEWNSAITRVFTSGRGSVVSTSVSTSSEFLGSSTQKIEYLRPIEIDFSITGFGNGEILESVSFDGVNVIATA